MSLRRAVITWAKVGGTLLVLAAAMLALGLVLGLVTAAEAEEAGIKASLAIVVVSLAGAAIAALLSRSSASDSGGSQDS